MTATDTKIFVVIPTKDRSEVLARALHTLANQTLLPSEVIVVDQSRVKVDISGLPFPVHHIYNPAITGAAQARNRAIDLIQCGIVLFLDDDVELEPDFIAQILAAYAVHPEADGVSGVITNCLRPPLYQRMYDRIFRLGPFFDERQPIYWNADRLRNRAPILVNKFSGGLMSFPRSRLGNIRFDERLTGVSLAEDAEFCHRLGKDAQLFIAPGARLVHLKTPAAREHFHWAEREMRSAYYYFERYGTNDLAGRLVFTWFNIGIFLLTIASSLRRRSLQPFSEFCDGAKAGRELGRRR